LRHTVRKERRSESIFGILFGSREKDPGGIIPDAIYTVLPHLYVCAGLLTIYVLRNWLAVFSGLAWISAAGIVWARRYRYRFPYTRSGGHIDFPTVIDANGPGDEVVQIIWQPSLECGHSIIDAQHRRLFGIGNLLVKAVLTNKLPGDVAWLFDELVDHMTEHFCTEEAVLAKAKHPMSRKIQEVHRTLLSKVVDLRDRYRSGQMPTGELVDFIVHDIITDYITKEAAEFSYKWSTRHSRRKRTRRNSLRRAA
jgi:hemerythrin-like metal-binding protein